MNKIKILGLSACACVAPVIFASATSCNKDSIIHVSDREKILNGDDKTVIVTGTDGTKLNDINLTIDGTSTIFAKVEGDVMINGETKLEFKLCDEVTTDVDNLVLNYSIAKKAKSIKGFRFVEIIPTFTVPTIEMSTETKGATGVNVTWNNTSSYLKLYDIVLWTNDGTRLARGTSWGDYKTSGSMPIELTFYPAITTSINDAVCTFSYTNNDSSIKGEARVTNIKVVAIAHCY